MWERMTKRWGYLLAILGREKTQKREIRLASHALIMETWQTLWMMHHHRCVVSYIYAAALRISRRPLAGKFSCAKTWRERDRVYVLTQTVPLQKNQTIFKKDWNQIVILLLEYVFDEEMISNGNMRGLTNGWICYNCWNLKLLEKANCLDLIHLFTHCLTMPSGG